MEASTTDQIREAATFASITLGILSAFAGQRSSSLAKQDGQLQDFTAAELRRDMLIDLFLAVFGVLLLAAAAPLFVAAVERLTPLFETATAFFSLFCLFYLGVALVVAWVANMTIRRARLLIAKTDKGFLPSLISPE